MDEAQVILDFLFPPHQQAACAVGPGVSRFDDPAAGAMAGATTESLFVAAANVRLVAAAPRDGQRRLPEVTRVEAQMVRGAAAGARPRHRNRTQRGLQKFLVVRVGTRDGNAQRNAAPVRKHRTLHAKLTAIGRVFAGFFPRPEATSSSPRPPLATAKRYRTGRHTSVSTLSKIGDCSPDAP